MKKNIQCFSLIRLFQFLLGIYLCNIQCWKEFVPTGTDLLIQFIFWELMLELLSFGIKKRWSENCSNFWGTWAKMFVAFIYTINVVVLICIYKPKFSIMTFVFINLFGSVFFSSFNQKFELIFLLNKYCFSYYEQSSKKR